MEKVTQNGIIYTFQQGAGKITQIERRESKNGNANDVLLSITFELIQIKNGENVQNNSGNEMFTDFDFDTSTLDVLIKGMNRRTNTCLVNAANFDGKEQFFVNCMNEGKLLPFTGIWVSVASMLRTAGVNGSSVLNTTTNRRATQHKRGFLGFIDDVETYVQSIYDNLLQNLEDGMYIVGNINQEPNNAQGVLTPNNAQRV